MSGARIVTLVPTYQLPPMPPLGIEETPRILRTLAIAHRRLGELKGRAETIPNQGILIDTLSLQEAKASSEIENIITTQEQLFQASLFPDGPGNADAKEVALYREALHTAFARQSELGNLLTNNVIIQMFQVLKRNDGGFRRTPGTALYNEQTGEHVYVPPQDAATINSAMAELESFINDDSASALDPLVKMAIIHHQFESIHPFPDGNGRIGRMINVLYLCRAGLLDIPILYLSRHITRTKGDYYRLLQEVRDTGEWENWILYILNAVIETSQTTLHLVEEIKALMTTIKHELRTNLLKIYSQDLLNSLFRHPYTRIDFLIRDLGVSRPTATKYLGLLAANGLLTKHRIGRDSYYVNDRLVSMLAEGAA